MCLMKLTWLRHWMDVEGLGISILWDLWWMLIVCMHATDVNQMRLLREVRRMHASECCEMNTVPYLYHIQTRLDTAILQTLSSWCSISMHKNVHYPVLIRHTNPAYGHLVCDMAFGHNLFQLSIPLLNQCRSKRFWRWGYWVANAPGCMENQKDRSIPTDTDCGYAVGWLCMLHQMLWV